MESVQLKLDDKGYGHFYIMEGNERIAEMEISVAQDNLTVYHTEVLPKVEGKGLAKQLLATMVDYVRRNAMKVIPLCPYVHAQFNRHLDEYADIWGK